MERSLAGAYLVALIVVMNIGSARAESNQLSPSDNPSLNEMIASIKETSTWCGRFMKSEYRYAQEDDGKMHVPQLSRNGVYGGSRHAMPAVPREMHSR